MFSFVFLSSSISRLLVTNGANNPLTSLSHNYIQHTKTQPSRLTAGCPVNAWEKADLINWLFCSKSVILGNHCQKAGWSFAYFSKLYNFDFVQKLKLVISSLMLFGWGKWHISSLYHDSSQVFMHRLSSFGWKHSTSVIKQKQSIYGHTALNS